jgi:uroporphyrinogen decarboxylase
VNGHVRLSDLARSRYREGRRVVAPLMGFPGVQLTDTNIKLAQQNVREHYLAIRRLVDRFQPDMVFPLMDLSVEANALGRYTIFPREESATIPKDVFDPGEIDQLRSVSIAFDTRLNGYVETMKLMTIGLPDHILRGAYVTGPYSLAALIMGADEAAVASAIGTEVLHRVCDLTVEKIHEYMHLLIAAGAQVICILEPSAVMLGPEQFEAFSADYVHHIVSSFKYSGVGFIYHTCGNTNHLIDKMCASGVEAISLDSPEMGVKLPEVVRRMPEDIVVMGNVSPTTTMLTGTPQEVEQEVAALLNQMEPYSNFILSTGCDLPQETPLENIHAFMKTGRRYRARSRVA